MSTESHSRPRSGRRRAAASLLLLGLVALALGAARPVGSSPPAPASAHAALDWLTGQLDGHGATLPGFTPGSTDWGLTADAVLAFVAAGRGSDVAARSATDALAAHVSEYTTWDPDVPGVRVAGATGKVLLVVASQGRDTSDVAGIDLEAELRSLMVTSGEARGRFADRVPDPTWDASNGFGQALSMLALAWTDDGVPAASVEFLSAQQCPGGGFRLTYTSPTCTSDSSADTDATALAVQALLAASPSPAGDAAVGRAVAWLLARQAPNGAVGGTGPTAAWNANSTGVVGQALRVAGRTAEADAAATWIRTMTQLASPEVDGTPAASDSGAIAYDPSARAAALASGISAGVTDQWRRATSQAVLALGLAPYAPVQAGPVVVPTTTVAPTTVDPTTSTVVPVTTVPITVAPDGLDTSTTTTAAPSSTVATAGLRATNASSTAGSSTSRVTPRPLAVTGQGSAPLVWTGLALLFVGAVIAGAGRRWSTR